jgi:hypothetical protein
MGLGDDFKFKISKKKNAFGKPMKGCGREGEDGAKAQRLGLASISPTLQLYAA